MADAERIIKIGTRGSPLALWQANHVADRLSSMHQGLKTELVVIKTKGDKILDTPLALIGGKGLFIKEIEQALLDGRADLAVHSMKDLPAELPDGLILGAMPKREDPRDVLICRDGLTFKELPKGAKVGTSSLRRKAQLLNIRPDLNIGDIRGNLGTRLKKLETEGFDAIVLAAAGVIRMGLTERISEFLDFDTMLPAVGQGALGIEIREDDSFAAMLAHSLDDEKTHLMVKAERVFLHSMEGSCQVPVAAHAVLEKEIFSITGLVAGIDGKPFLREKDQGADEKATEIAENLAQRLLDAGGRKILDDLKLMER